MRRLDPDGTVRDALGNAIGIDQPAAAVCYGDHLALIAQAVRDGSPGVDGDGCCLGCGRLAEHVAEGAASDCEVCRAFLDWMEGDDDADA